MLLHFEIVLITKEYLFPDKLISINQTPLRKFLVPIKLNSIQTKS